MTAITDERHVAYMDSRYMYTDANGVDIHTEEHPVYCNDWKDGSMALCDDCEDRAKQEYPQGWNWYPGDICEHGKYVGGCGIDLMCQWCEDGD